MDVHALLSWAEEKLLRARVPSPRTDAEWMMTYILHCGRSDLAVHPPILPRQVKMYRSLVFERAKRVPLQHVLGETEFYGLPFESGPAALIPRPDTETLVESVIHRLAHHRAPQVLDLGTGSGIIAIAIAHALKTSRVLATDLSRPALQLARRNAHLNKVGERTHFIQCHMLSGLSESHSFDAIVSNPPYIPSAEIAGLQPEVRDHDPHTALDGGASGLDYYLEIIPESLQLLKQNGILALEVGDTQSESVLAILAQFAAFESATTHLDLSGRTRFIIAKKQS